MAKLTLMSSPPSGFLIIVEEVPRGREDVAPRLCAKIFNVPHPRPTVDMSGGEFVSMSFLVTMTSIDMSKLADFVRDVEAEFAK